MNEILAPCNSLAELDPLSGTSQTSTAFNSPDTMTSIKRKSRLSETDFSIIEKTMSLERKKTLMCTEQSNFQVLHKIGTKKLPTKKYKAVAISQYEKHVLKELNISLKARDELKYEYPKDIQGASRTINKQEKNVNEKGKGTRTTVCSIF